MIMELINSSTEYSDSDILLPFWHTVHWLGQNLNTLILIKKRPLQCTECPKTCSYIQHLNVHMKRMHPSINMANPTFEMCQMCKKVYYEGRYFSKHECLTESDTKLKLYQCTECDTTCLAIGNLRQHLAVKHPAIHENNLVSQFCAKCGRMYCVAPSLASHVCQTGRAGHRKGKDDSIPNVKFSCDICGTIFISRYELRHHLNMHVNRDRFLCDLCNRTYSSMLSLQNHFKTHSSLV